MSTDTRRVVGVTTFGGPDALEVSEVAAVEPAPGEVAIRVAAAAVNPTDTGVRTGAYGKAVEDLPRPVVPGMDAAGIVQAVGEGVDLAVGARVMAAVAPMRPAGGAYTELLTLPADQVTAVPDGTGLYEAATLPMNGLTAKVAHDVLALEPGQTFGVTGAAGVLGQYAIAIAKHHGLTVVADAKEDDVPLVESFGADVVVARGEDVGGRMRDATDGGVDGLLDASVQHAQVLPAIRDGGHLVSIRPFEGDLERDVQHDLVMVFDHLDDQEGLQLVRDLAADGRIVPRVADTYAPEQAPDAHRRFEAGGVRGRLLLTFGDDG